MIKLKPASGMIIGLKEGEGGQNTGSGDGCRIKSKARLLVIEMAESGENVSKVERSNTLHRSN